MFDEEGEFDSSLYSQQWDYINKAVRPIQYSIFKFQDYPVQILNNKHLIQMIDGINNTHDASFIHLMSNSKKYTIRARYVVTDNIFDIITKFDDAIDFVYGKC